MSWPIGAVIVLLGVALVLTLVASSHVRKLAPSKMGNPDGLVFPRSFVIEHWGKHHVGYREYDPDTGKVGYRIESCGHLVASEKHAEAHMRKAHSNMGRITSVILEPAEEAIKQTV